MRSRLGVWLLLLGALAVVEGTRAASSDLMLIALRVGMLGGVLGIAFGAGSDADRAALAVTLTHPTTPLAVALGRWLAALTAAGAATLVALGVAAGLLVEPGIAVARAALVGVTAAAATAAVTLAGVWLGGNTVAGAFFLYIAAASAVPPDAIESLFPPGPARDVGIAVVRAAPGVWRYRTLAAGSGAAWLHAATCILGGVACSAALLRRRVS